MTHSLLRAELALMSILRQNQLPACGSIELQRLRHAWPRYGLRGRDLLLGLERLEALGMVRIEHDQGRRSISLTAKGERWSMSVSGLLARIALIPRQVQSHLNRLFGRQDAKHHRARRVSDKLAED